MDAAQPGGERMTRRSSRRADAGPRPPRWWERDGKRYYVGAIVVAAAVIAAVYVLRNGE